jgi:hypothetical protein
MVITAAAEKTIAAFLMGFPFNTKIVIDNKNQIRWLRPQGPPRNVLTAFNVDERPLVSRQKWMRLVDLSYGEFARRSRPLPNGTLSYMACWLCN